MTLESIDTLETQPLLDSRTPERLHQDGLDELLPRYNASTTSSPASPPPSPTHHPRANSILHNYIFVNGLPTSTSTLHSTAAAPSSFQLLHSHPHRRKSRCPAWFIFFSMCMVFLVSILLGSLYIYPSFFTVTIWKTSLDNTIPTPMRLQLFPPSISIYTMSDVGIYNPLIFPLYKLQFKVKAYSPRFNPPLLLGQSTKWVELYVPARSTHTLHVPMLLTFNSTPETPILHVVLKLLDECEGKGALMLDAFVNITLAKNRIWNDLTFATQRRMHVGCH